MRSSRVLRAAFACAVSAVTLVAPATAHTVPRDPAADAVPGKAVFDDGSAVTPSATGFAPADAREAANLVTPNPGAYAAVVTGAAGATGVAIVEVFTR